MGLQLQHDLKAGTWLFSLGELGRVLNIPETRLDKAVSSGAIQPLGTVGRNVIVAFSSREICALVDAFKKQVEGDNPRLLKSRRTVPSPKCRGRNPP